MLRPQWFTLEEFKSPDGAIWTFDVVNNLWMLVVNVLDPCREYMGRPIRINSGYRSPAHNLKVGGVASSQHVKGMAADCDCGTKDLNKVLYGYIAKNLAFDQVILEHGGEWVHVSYDETHNRREVLKIG